MEGMVDFRDGKILQDYKLLSGSLQKVLKITAYRSLALSPY